MSERDVLSNNRKKTPATRQGRRGRERLIERPWLQLICCAERVQKGIAHWDKQNHAVPAPNCVLKVRGEIIKDEGL